MNTQQIIQSRVIEAIFDIHEKLIFELGDEKVVFPPLLDPEV